jgi:hypothetical protein
MKETAITFCQPVILCQDRLAHFQGPPVWLTVLVVVRMPVLM